MNTMDTINNLATAASRAIWGENKAGEEPVSGKTGNVAAGEPYDAGNIEPNNAALSSAEQKEAERGNTRTPASTANEHANGPAIATAPDAEAEAEAEADTKPAQNEDAKETPAHPAGPAETAPSASSMRDDSTKAQNDTRPPHPPSTSTAATSSSDKTEAKPDQTKPAEEAASATSSSAAAEKPAADKLAGAKEDDNPVNIEGPGPRPVEEIAREHGGDAGAAKPESLKGKEGEEEGEGAEGGSTRRRDSGKSLGGGDEGAEDKEKEGAGGTGEEYVRSSGLAADGGDFDAARPGAGREADRLLEEKGMRKGEAGDSHGHGSGGKEKIGLKDKIKAKLHKSSVSA